MPPKQKAYGMAPIVPAGTVLTDLRLQQYKLGEPFASGGFGRIYTAKKIAGDGVGQNYVIKIEPYGNPAIEKVFYQKVAKVVEIDAWKQSRHLKFLGVPPFVGSGTIEQNGKNCFLVLNQYGPDLDKVRLEHGGSFTPPDVFNIAVNCVNILEYIHDHNYVHGDLKGENLLVKDSSGRHDTDVFLVDYGLARWINSSSLVYKEGKLGAHDGTLMFTSLDAHKGVVTSFRSDMEILNFNLVYWLTGTLPWAKSLGDPARVKLMKENFMENLSEQLRAALPPHPAYFNDLLSVFEYVKSLGYTERPDYNYLRTKFQQAAIVTPTSSNCARNPSKSSPSSRKRERPDPKDLSAASNGHSPPRQVTDGSKSSSTKSPQPKTTAAAKSQPPRKKRILVVPDSSDESGRDSDWKRYKSPATKRAEAKRAAAACASPKAKPPAPAKKSSLARRKSIQILKKYANLKRKSVGPDIVQQEILTPPTITTPVVRKTRAKAAIKARSQTP